MKQITYYKKQENKPLRRLAGVLTQIINIKKEAVLVTILLLS